MKFKPTPPRKRPSLKDSKAYSASRSQASEDDNMKDLGFID